MNEKAKKIAVSLFLGFIMITSVIGIVLVNYGSNSGELNYKGQRFSRLADGSLQAKIDGKDVIFLYFPAEVEGINVSREIIDLIRGTRMVYMTSDYYGNFSKTIGIAGYNLGLALSDVYSIFSVQGFVQNVTALPVISCNNATSSVPVIMFREGNETGIYKEGDCIIIESSDSDGFIKARDRLFYGVSGIMDGT
ncbi:hypothetical protein HYU11_03550 [Candidatus Woesearchaeota archaeon]|nr:hypothetical protein [Candidatus Woesearchaeota archaeon]